MTNLKQRLEEKRDAMSEQAFYGLKLSPHQKDIYCEGFESLLPLVLMLAEGLEAFAQTDICETHPDATWLANWRNSRKTIAQGTIKKLEAYLSGESEAAKVGIGEDNCL